MSIDFRENIDPVFAKIFAMLSFAIFEFGNPTVTVIRGATREFPRGGRYHSESTSLVKFFPKTMTSGAERGAKSRINLPPPLVAPMLIRTSKNFLSKNVLYLNIRRV